MLIAAGRNAVLLLRLDTIMIKRKGGEILGEQRAGQAENSVPSVCVDHMYGHLYNTAT